MTGRTGTVLVTVLATLAVLAVAGLAFVYSGAYDVAATTGHDPLVRWVLHAAAERSIAARAHEVGTPPAADSAALAHGFEHFDAMCVRCHGAPGVDRGELGQGLAPTPPELADEAEELSPQELFWVTKHGIKMTGMPAFGPTHSDEEIWGIVAFVEELPGMSSEGYAEWRERHGAAAGDSAARGGGHSHEPGAPAHSH